MANQLTKTKVLLDNNLSAYVNTVRSLHKHYFLKPSQSMIESRRPALGALFLNNGFGQLTKDGSNHNRLITLGRTKRQHSLRVSDSCLYCSQNWLV